MHVGQPCTCTDVPNQLQGYWWESPPCSGSSESSPAFPNKSEFSNRMHDQKPDAVTCKTCARMCMSCMKWKVPGSHEQCTLACLPAYQDDPAPI